MLRSDRKSAPQPPASGTASPSDGTPPAKAQRANRRGVLLPHPARIGLLRLIRRKRTDWFRPVHLGLHHRYPWLPDSVGASGTGGVGSKDLLRSETKTDLSDRGCTGRAPSSTTGHVRSHLKAEGLSMSEKEFWKQPITALLAELARISHTN